MNSVGMCMYGVFSVLGLMWLVGAKIIAWK
jgi:hypothetical protein